LITKELAVLLLAPILIDTINLEPSRNRVTPTDSAAAQTLLSIAQVDQLEFFNELQAAKFNDDALSTVDKLRKDYKGGQVGAVKYGISAVLASVEQWLAKESQLTQQFDAFMQQHGLELLFATLAYYDAQNKFYREMIVYGRNGQQIVDRLPVEFKLRPMHTERTKQAVESSGSHPLIFYHVENIDVARKVLQPSVDQVLKGLSANI
jgi:inorganic pyrophosphatase/exopolyphosphatase